MNLHHPTLDRLEADELTERERHHLRSCARCRVDRRELRSTAVDDLTLAELELVRGALIQARQDGSRSLLSAWRTLRSESEVTRPDRAADLLPSGLLVGRYRLDSLLGRGGMAIVYRARHEDLATWHAIKVLSVPGVALRERLLREGRLQARLRHRNVVGVTDVVEVGGAPALVLEYVSGPSLHEVLREGPLTPSEIDAIAIDILTGMAAAHAQGFVHRDLKPSNVLLEPNDDRAIAKVSDFGLAKALAGEPLDALQTRTGGVLGTLLYMAPEQLRDPRRADARSDVFALGAMLYEIVSGNRCFAGVDVVDIMQRVSSARHESLPTDVPERWVRTIEAALALDPTRRPPDAAALLGSWTSERPASWPGWSRDRLDDLRENHRPRPLPTRPPEPAAPSRMRTRRLGFISAASIGALTMGGIGLAAMLPPTRAPQAALSLVHEVPGAPDRLGGTRLTAVFADDLLGLHDASCVPEGRSCAAALPAPGTWLPLVAPPAGASLLRGPAHVSLGGVVAELNERVYEGVGNGWAAGNEIALQLDGHTHEIPVRLPDLPGLDHDATRPLQIAANEGPTLRWTPGGAGVPFLEVRPRQSGRGRIYTLSDTGAFTVPPEALPAAPSQTDLVFGRQTTTAASVGGHDTSIMARTAQWLTVVRLAEDRIELAGVGSCEETKSRVPMSEGPYWGMFYTSRERLDLADYSACLPETAKGPVYWFPVEVPEGERRGLRVRQLGGDPMVGLTRTPFCQPTDCLQGRDRPGESEALIIDGLSGKSRTFNLGIWDKPGTGGTFLVDVIRLEPPSTMRPHVKWDDGGVTLTVESVADVEFRFGLAETASPNGWYGEDCLRGQPDRGVAVCHEVIGDSLRLDRVPMPRHVIAGKSTLMWAQIGSEATFYLETPNILRDDGTPWCVVWGHDPAYYAERGCEIRASGQNPD